MGERIAPSRSKNCFPCIATPEAGHCSPWSRVASRGNAVARYSSAGRSVRQQSVGFRGHSTVSRCPPGRHRAAVWSSTECLGRLFGRRQRIGSAAILVTLFAVISPSLTACSSSGRPSSPATSLSLVLGLPIQEFDNIGNGVVGEPFHRADTHLQRPVTVIFIGAEYSPQAAIVRWSLLAALSRFGSIDQAAELVSSSIMTPANLDTFTLRRVMFRSSMVRLDAAEVADRSGKPLQKLDAAQTALVNEHRNAGGLPLIQIASEYYETGLPPGLDPAVLQGLSWKQIVSLLRTPASALARQVIGEASYIVAAICRATGPQGAEICRHKTTEALETTLP